MGLGQLNQANLHPTRHEFKRRQTQLNLSPIGARNQRKFASNPSPIRIRIPACTLVSIFGINFGSDVQSRWFKLGWKVNLKGYNFVVYQKSEFRHLNGPKTSVKWSLKIWDFFQTRIQLVLGFLDLFKGSLGQNSDGAEASARAEGWMYRECGRLFLWFSSMTVSFILFV